VTENPKTSIHTIEYLLYSYVVCFLNQGLPALVLHEIQLLKDAHHTDIEEEKISSSSLRSRLLGTLLTPPKVSPRTQLNSFIGFLCKGKGCDVNSEDRQWPGL